MTVSELIVKLQQIENKDVVVKLEDWNEEYSGPHELEKIACENGYVLLGVLHNDL